MAYGLGQYREREMTSIIAKASLEQKQLEAANLKYAALVECERQQRLAADTRLQKFKYVGDLSDEALAGSGPSYDKLVTISHEVSDLGKRAQERLLYIRRGLAYYNQPAGIVLALELSETINGKKLRIVEFPTSTLFKLLQNEDISDSTRFSIINDICTKPIAEVDTLSLAVLKTSHYLPAIAATTAILGRFHKGAASFMDKSSWIQLLEKHRNVTNSGN